MSLHKKEILLISPEPWDHIFVCKHHFATHLGKRGNRVYFLNPPLKELSCSSTNYKNVFSVHYGGFVKGLRFLPPFIQCFLINQKFLMLQKLCGVKFDIIWSFDNSVFYDFSALPKSVFCISHIVDWNQDFEFKKASETAHLCLASTTYIAEKQKRYNTNSYNIGHGFNNVKAEFEKFALKGHNKINCGYAGNLDIKYIDWGLVETLVNTFPNVDFHFAGKWDQKDQFSPLVKRDNFYYYGKFSSDVLPAFYASMDLLLIVYKYEKYPEQLANPHKMMEYLASGKMIIATWTSEYEDLFKEEYILMSEDVFKYKDLFAQAIANIEYWNSTEKTLKRHTLALSNTYSKKIVTIEKIIY